jgi:hypothetical protein
MPNKLRRLGVFGVNLPTKKARVIEASDFLIGGLIVQAERKYNQAFEVRNMNEYQEIFGTNFSSSYYGYDSVNMFFQNASGTDATLYVKAHVGNTGSALDAVNASSNLADTEAAPATTLVAKAAYKTILEYGVHGNRIGYTVTAGTRFTTAANGAGVKTDTFALLDSVAGIRVGDIVKFVATAGGGATVYKKILTVDESLGKVTFAGAFDGSANLADNDVVTVPGFIIKVYEKSISGIVKEVETDIGKIVCTMEPEVTDFYVVNVFANHKYLVLTDSGVTPVAIFEAFPAAVATVTYLASGADGTAATTNAHWLYGNEAAFTGKPIRFLANCETTLETVNKSLEVYSKARWDNPIILGNIASNQTKAQLQTIAGLYQRSDDVLTVNTAHWLQIEDPFSTSALAALRNVPNVGALMGAWIRTIGMLGIHYVPAVKQIPLYGVAGIYGTQFTDDFDRTDLAEYGMNCLEYLSGYGYVIRNWFTPSMADEYLFGNGLLMRNYIKVSCVDSLSSTENTPNSFTRIKEDRMAIIMFGRKHWESGSTGTVSTGETFGITESADGSFSVFEDHFECQADIVNNPQSSINVGQRNFDICFTYPSPAGSIRVGTGFML